MLFVESLIDEHGKPFVPKNVSTVPICKPEMRHSFPVHLQAGPYHLDLTNWFLKILLCVAALRRSKMNAFENASGLCGLRNVHISCRPVAGGLEPPAEGRQSNLYSASYLQFGLREAHRLLQRQLIAKALVAEQTEVLEHPCGWDLLGEANGTHRDLGF